MEPERTTWRVDWLIAAGLMAVVLAIYSPWLGNEFVYDDYPEIVDWPLMHSPSRIPQFFTTADVGLYRPLKYAAVSALWAAGGGTPGVYHVAAMLAHAASAILLFLIFRRLDFASAPAGVGALVFAVHPAQAESVYWISALSVPISTALLFAAFLTALAVSRCSASARGWLLMAATLILLLMALMFREAAVVFPAFLLLYVLSPVRPFISREARSRFAILVLSSAVLVVSFWLWRGWLMERQPHEFEYFAGSFGGALLTAPYLVMRYLIMFVMPVDLTVYHWPRIARSVFSPVFFMPVLTLAAMGWLAWRRRRTHPRGLFFLGCFGAALIPVLNLIPINSVFAERYLYLPMMGLCGLAAWGFEQALAAARVRGKARLMILGVAGVILVMISLSLARGRVWQNDVTLFNDATEKTPPQAIMPRYNLAKALAQRGQTFDAIDVYREVITAAPDHVPSLLNLSNLLMREGDLSTAEKALIQADNAAPGNSFVLNGLGTIWFRRGDDERAFTFFEAAAESQPPNPQAHFNAGMTRKRQGRLDEARDWFRRALDLAPDYEAAAEELRQLDRAGPQSGQV